MLLRALVLGMSLVFTLACGDEEGANNRKRPADSNTGGVGGGNGGAGGAGGEDPGAGGAGGQDPGGGGAGGGAPGAGGTGGGAPGAGGSGGDDPGTEGYNIAFVTSTTYPGDFGGLEVADEICNELARNAGLSGSYIAWLSDTSVNARDRIGSARGWVRRDGRPFAATVEDLIGYSVLYPLLIDEKGERTTESWVWTGTRSGDGVATDKHCGDWRETEGLRGTVGETNSMSGQWTFRTNYPCTSRRPLYCLGISHEVDLPAPEGVGRLAFTTQAAFNPKPEGLAAADSLCQQEAEDAGLSDASNPRRFKALLATQEASAISRFDTSGPMWISPDGWPILDSAQDAEMREFLRAPNLKLDGSRPTTNGAWIGASALNEVGTVESTCEDWTSAEGDATGSAMRLNQIRASTGWPSRTCDHASTRLICLEE